MIKQKIKFKNKYTMTAELFGLLGVSAIVITVAIVGLVAVFSEKTHKPAH